MFPDLVVQDAGDAGSIQDFKQTARTLTGTVKRALDATTDRANLGVTLTLVNEALAQFAVTIEDIPNALFETVEPLRSFLDNMAKFQAQKAIDMHVVAQVVAAEPTFGNTGADLIARVMYLGTMDSSSTRSPGQREPVDAASRSQGFFHVRNIQGARRIAAT